jgi:hypothetical protein
MPFDLSSRQLLCIAGSVIILCCGASIVIIMSWHLILIGSNPIASISATTSSSIAVVSVYGNAAALTRNPLEENMRIFYLLELHKYARAGMLTTSYHITACFDKKSSHIDNLGKTATTK